MVERRLKLTGLRRLVLSALEPGRGESADELRRRVALDRGLSPDGAGWRSFCTSFARALRLLEGRERLEVLRSETFFKKPCAVWVRLTAQGERERERVAASKERGLFGLAPEASPLGSLDLAQASDLDLARLARRLEAERARRASRESGLG